MKKIYSYKCEDLLNDNIYYRMTPTEKTVLSTCTETEMRWWCVHAASLETLEQNKSPQKMQS